MSVLEELEVRDLREPAERIAKARGITLDVMFGASRERHVTGARKEFYAVLVERGWSVLAIGKFCGRDHTTVANALSGKRRKNGH